MSEITNKIIELRDRYSPVPTSAAQWSVLLELSQKQDAEVEHQRRNSEANWELYQDMHAKWTVATAALKGLEYADDPGRFCDHAAAPCQKCDAARLALNPPVVSGTKTP